MDLTLFPEGQCRLLLIGKTGNGKSSTGNTILGKESFQPKLGINSGTKDGSLESVEMNGIKLQVLDTPGLHDTKKKDEEIMRRITRSLMSIHPGPHAVLLCLSCADRFTSEEMQVLNTLKDSFGEALMDHLVVVMVKKDLLGEHAGVTFKAQLEECRELKALITAVKDRYVLFDNRPGVNPEVRELQVQALMVKVMEVVRQNEGSYFKHKMTAEMETSMIKMKRAELKAHGMEDIIEKAEEHRPTKRAPKLSELREEESQKSFIALEKKGIVFRNLGLFENLAQEHNDGRSRRQTLNRSVSISDPDLSLSMEERDARATLGMANDTEAPDLSREEIAAKFTMKGVKKPQAKPRPKLPKPPPPLSPPPARQATDTEDQSSRDKNPHQRHLRTKSMDSSSSDIHFLMDSSQQLQEKQPQQWNPNHRQDMAPERQQDENPPQKPARLKPENPDMQSVMEAVKQLETEQQQPGDHSMQQRVPGLRMEYVVPDKPGITMAEKQAMVEYALRRKLARGERLKEEQEEEVEVVSRSIGQKIKESMQRFRVTTLEKCSVM